MGASASSRRHLDRRSSRPLLVSIVIVNWNGRELLRRCLASLKKHLRLPHEIIVVDNGSADGSVEYLRRQLPAVRVIALPRNEGFCHANNRGVREAQGRYLLFLNNDTVAHNDFLAPLVRYLAAHPEVGLVQPKLYQDLRTKKLDSCGSFFSATGFLVHRGYRAIDTGQFKEPDEIFSPKGAAMLTPRALFVRLGGFDEAFFAYNEETDLAWRIWLAGKSVVFYPHAFLEHTGGQTERRLDFNYIQFHSFKNRLRMLGKNCGLGTLLRVLPLYTAMVGGFVLLLLITGRARKAFTVARSFQWNLFRVRNLWGERARIQRKLRTRPDREFLPRLTRGLDLVRGGITIGWFLNRTKWDAK